MGRGTYRRYNLFLFILTFTLRLWISSLLAQQGHVPCEEELGGTLPLGIKPWTIVVLHECAHILMNHFSDVERAKFSVEVREERADCWAWRYITI